MRKRDEGIDKSSDLGVETLVIPSLGIGEVRRDVKSRGKKAKKKCFSRVFLLDVGSPVPNFAPEFSIADCCICLA